MCQAPSTFSRSAEAGLGGGSRRGQFKIKSPPRFVYITSRMTHVRSRLKEVRMNAESGASKAKSNRQRARQLANRWAYVRTAKADARAKQLVPELTVRLQSGAGSYRILALALVAAGLPAPRMGFWTALAAKRLSERVRRAEASQEGAFPTEVSSITRRQNYREFSKTVRWHLREASAAGVESLNGIARHLNRQKVRSFTGQLWSPSSVLHLRQVLQRAE
ncbi:MAG: hypothetical protein JWL93_1048 [Hyphomicrobiales bacterium]|nr:hypothetical protein [Hyphomicrobiales bacterium]